MVNPKNTSLISTSTRIKFDIHDKATKKSCGDLQNDSNKKYHHRDIDR